LPQALKQACLVLDQYHKEHKHSYIPKCRIYGWYKSGKSHIGNWHNKAAYYRISIFLLILTLFAILSINHTRCYSRN